MQKEDSVMSDEMEFLGEMDSMLVYVSSPNHTN